MVVAHNSPPTLHNLCKQTGWEAAAEYTIFFFKFQVFPSHDAPHVPELQGGLSHRPREGFTSLAFFGKF